MNLIYPDNVIEALEQNVIFANENLKAVNLLFSDFGGFSKKSIFNSFKKFVVLRIDYGKHY